MSLASFSSSKVGHRLVLNYHLHFVPRFWKCQITKTEVGEKKFKKKVISSYEWIEWDMLRKDHKSVIEIPGSSVFYFCFCAILLIY